MGVRKQSIPYVRHLTALSPLLNQVVAVAVADCVADDFVITDSAPVVKAAMAEPELAVVEEQVRRVSPPPKTRLFLSFFDPVLRLQHANQNLMGQHAARTVSLLSSEPLYLRLSLLP